MEEVAPAPLEEVFLVRLVGQSFSRPFSSWVGIDGRDPPGSSARGMLFSSSVLSVVEFENDNFVVRNWPSGAHQDGELPSFA